MLHPQISTDGESLHKNERGHQNTQEVTVSPLQTSSAGSAASGQKQFVEFKIAGVPYKVKTEIPRDVFLGIAQSVDEQVQEALKLTKNSSFQTAAVMTALNLAEEIHHVKLKARHEFETLEKRMIKLSQELKDLKEQHEAYIQLSESEK